MPISYDMNARCNNNKTTTITTITTTITAGVTPITTWGIIVTGSQGGGSKWEKLRKVVCRQFQFNAYFYGFSYSVKNCLKSMLKVIVEINILFEKYSLIKKKGKKLQKNKEKWKKKRRKLYIYFFFIRVQSKRGFISIYKAILQQGI